MKNAIILHGMPDKENYYDANADAQSNCHWLPWIQQQLIVSGVLAQTPEMPKPYEPNYQSWLKVFNQFDVNKDTILIGHSCGGGFLTKWLTENDVKVKKVILVAPWIDPENSVEMFSKFKVGNDLVVKTLDGVTTFNSDNDYPDIQDSAKKIKEANPGVKVRDFHNYGHFCYKDMKTREFPELLEEALK